MARQKYIFPDDEQAEDKLKVLTRKMNRWRKRRLPESLKELNERTDEYFETVETLELCPSIEQLCLCLGLSRTTFFRYLKGQGCAEDWQAVCIAARQTVIAGIAAAGDEGKLSPVLTIWREKTTSGYRDNKSIADVENVEQIIDSWASPLSILAKYEPLLADKGEEETVAVEEYDPVFVMPDPKPR